MHTGSLSETVPEEMEFTAPANAVLRSRRRGGQRTWFCSPREAALHVCYLFPEKKTTVLSQAETCQNDINTPDMSKQSVRLRFPQEVWPE